MVIEELEVGFPRISGWTRREEGEVAGSIANKYGGATNARGRNVCPTPRIDYVKIGTKPEGLTIGLFDYHSTASLHSGIVVIGCHQMRIDERPRPVVHDGSKPGKFFALSQSKKKLNFYFCVGLECGVFSVPITGRWLPKGSKWSIISSDWVDYGV